VKVAVVALGKIGLPLAVQFAKKGHEVVGVDVNVNTVDSINKGREPFPGEAFLAEYLQSVVANGSLTATTRYAEAIPNADVVVVVVPLFVNLDGTPEFARLDDATASIGRHLTPGTTVLYETTLPVGTTRNRWVPRLEEASELRCGSDFFVAYSPERVLTGRVFADLRAYPKIVGGVDAESAKRAELFYQDVLDFDDRPDLSQPNGVWDVDEFGGLRTRQTCRNDVLRREHWIGQPIRSPFRTAGNRRLQRDPSRKLATF
jgi:UDP-N-acetyl-D-glucosamine dehydrogenase